MEKQKVYLAGGFGSDWANGVAETVKNVDFINPKCKEFKNGDRINMSVEEYGALDLHFIKMSNIVFVYVEQSNPSCIGLSCEAGYANGLGKTVITVIEPNNKYIKDSSLAFISAVSDVVFDNLNDGVKYLKSFVI